MSSFEEGLFTVTCRCFVVISWMQRPILTILSNLAIVAKLGNPESLQNLHLMWRHFYVSSNHPGAYVVNTRGVLAGSFWRGAWLWLGDALASANHSWAFCWGLLVRGLLALVTWAPGSSIASVFAARRGNFGQWHRSFQRKLRSHWLKFLRHVAATLVFAGPCIVRVNCITMYCSL